MQSNNTDRVSLDMATSAWKDAMRRARAAGKFDLPSVPSIVSPKSKTLLSVNRTRYAETFKR